MKKQAVLGLGDARLDKVKLQFEALSQIKGGGDGGNHDLTLDVGASVTYDPSPPSRITTP